mmetsp:Transcript_24927/g.74811  ORF Transcript_24927/g.74811 Transcript_24927/m.74811 type:complete len:128 (-) Transcript_24927:707-1090(-)
MRCATILIIAAATHAFHPPERVGAGSVRTLARPPGPLDQPLDNGRAATRRRASDADLADALAGNETGGEVAEGSEKQILPFVLGAGALSVATYGLFAAWQDTHAPGLAITALCLFGCWAALTSRALA